MLRVIVVAFALTVCLGCGRSADNGAGFDQAVQDMKHGVKPGHGSPRAEYRRGYREAVDAVERGVQRKEAHSAAQKRAQQLHERMPRK
jgi:hypothetical protein